MTARDHDDGKPARRQVDGQQGDGQQGDGQQAGGRQGDGRGRTVEELGQELGQELDQELDLRGLKCPLPVLRTRRALARAAPGTVLAVTCTDPLAAIDIPHLVRETGHRLEASTGDGRALTFVIRVCQAGD